MAFWLKPCTLLLLITNAHVFCVCSVTPSWMPEYSLDFEGNVNPEMINRYYVTMEMNKDNFGEEGAPSLAKQASALLASEFLAVIHPPNERSPRIQLEIIDPECSSDGECELNYTVRDNLAFTFYLALHEFPLPGVNPEQLKPDEHGHFPPTKGATAVVKIQVIAGEKIDVVALEQFGTEVAAWLKIDEPGIVVHRHTDGETTRTGSGSNEKMDESPRIEEL